MRVPGIRLAHAGSAAARKVASGDVICEECGETNKPNSEFCAFCGAYLGWQAGQGTRGASDTTQPLPVQPPAPQPAAAPTASQARPDPGPSRTAALPPHAQPAPMAASRPQPVAQAPAAPPVPQPAATAVAAYDIAPSPSQPSQAAPQPAAPAGCPSCGRPVEAGRRFCGHCGQQFVGPGGAAPSNRPVAQRDTWWSRLWNSKDRAARRSYRRSLPPLYRWRRVIITVLVLILVGAGLTVIGRSPTSFILARYYDVRGTLAPVKSVIPSTIPADGSAPGSDPAALVDQTAAAWAMPWTDQTQGSGCGTTPTTTVVQLEFDQIRLRQIDLRAGLLANNPNRQFQYRPKDVWIAYGDQCVPMALEDVERQPLTLDTKVPVSSIRIGVQSAYPPAQPAGAQPVLTITEITLLARPRVR
ncbi:MAG TPA: zinc ribbon domain-containing protein [Microlunatus sp.]|nr:zinc ribbon domain-containing protein [Microlunatus sp.]